MKVGGASSFSLLCLLSHLGAPWEFDSRGVLQPSGWTSSLKGPGTAERRGWCGALEGGTESAS